MKVATRARTRGLAGLALVAGTLGAAAPAQALTPPAPPMLPDLWAMPPGQPEQKLGPVGGCSSHFGQPLCVDVPAIRVAPLVLAQPTTVRIRSSLPLAALAVGAPAGGQLEGAPTISVTRRDDFLWNVALDGVRDRAQLGFSATLSDVYGGGTWTSSVQVDAQPASVEIVSHSQRGRSVTAVVSASSPGELRAYATVRGRRRSRVVTATAAAGTETRLTIPVAAAALPGLGRAGGITVVLRPSDGRATTRDAVAWRVGKSVRAPAKGR